MPPESLWIQYNIIGILLLAAGVIAGAFYKLWHELLAWIEKQDLKRETEREKQRTWEAQQVVLRDAQSQGFLKTMQDQWLAQDNRHAAVLTKLVEKIDV